MKTIETKDGVRRMDEETAAELVLAGKATYCPKSKWKVAQSKVEKKKVEGKKKVHKKKKDTGEAVLDILNTVEPEEGALKEVHE